MLTMDIMPSVHLGPTECRSLGRLSERTTAPTQPTIKYQLLASLKMDIVRYLHATDAPCARPGCWLKYSGSIVLRTFKNTPFPIPTNNPCVMRSSPSYMTVRPDFQHRRVSLTLWHAAAAAKPIVVSAALAKHNVRICLPINGSRAKNNIANIATTPPLPSDCMAAMPALFISSSGRTMPALTAASLP